MEARRNAGVWGITRAFPIQFTWACSLAGRPTLKQEVELRAVSKPKITTSNAWNSANEQVFKALSSLETVTVVVEEQVANCCGQSPWPLDLRYGSPCMCSRDQRLGRRDHSAGRFQPHQTFSTPPAIFRDCGCQRPDVRDNAQPSSDCCGSVPLPPCAAYRIMRVRMNVRQKPSNNR
ncbi:hypothetical protein BC629DRAFT_1171770 [Irpex lacteus]|nr:hypothetical protein BC629DRAFT_1171770 [Irpex lacteus]